jgi:2',3'-cyclic-nucleotide 2'-phosphodiesterase (5'-nucleotidase family)
MYEPIDPDKQYSVLLSKYIAGGGDQFKMIQEGIIKSTDLGEYLNDET